MSFPFTRFDSLAGTSLAVEDLDIDRLKALVETAVAARKEDLQLGKLAVFGSLPSPPGSNGAGGGSLRWDGNLRVT
jgi:hypothetical protein